MILAQATPIPSEWSPAGVVAVISCVALVLIPSITGLVMAFKALNDAKTARLKAEGMSRDLEHNATRIESVQRQVSAVALATQPPASAAPRSPVVPATFTEAQLRAATDPDCPETPPPGAPAGWVPSVPPDKPKGT